MLFFYDKDRIIVERERNTWVVRCLLGLKPCGFVIDGGVRVYHADRLGSVRWVTDEGRNTMVSYVYEGFGKIIGQNGGGGGSYQFCGLWGYRNDWDAGLMHVGARYYEVETGRFVQKDLWLGDIYNIQTLNQYIYCLNDPINRVDPDGMKWRWTDWLEAIGAFITALGGLVYVAGPSLGPPLVAVGCFIFLLGLGYEIGEEFGNWFFPPDKRCCGGECDRNPPPKPLPPIRAIGVCPFPLSAVEC